MTFNVKITLSTRDVSRVLVWCGRVNTTEHSEIKCAYLTFILPNTTLQCQTFAIKRLINNGAKNTKMLCGLLFRDLLLICCILHLLLICTYLSYLLDF